MAFKPDDHLAPYEVKTLELGESKGAGCYGAVYRVKVNGFPCIAKRLHDILVGQVSARARAAITGRFRDECILLSKLRHPNIVQFIGVHYGRTRDDLTLVMECLYTDLDKCLEKCVEEKRTLPLPLQLSILLDVAYGLLYLHFQEPLIIHRDLKAENVLLTPDMRAKLADLGVSKILDLHPMSEMAQTICPGSPGIMPPEALVQNPEYDEKLDDFSFGTLALNVVNHEFATPYEVPLGQQYRAGEVHIARRMASIIRMGRQHCLYDLVIRCLQDDPKKRPTTAEICAKIEHLTKDHPHQFKDVLEMRTEIAELLRVNNEWDVEYKEQEAAFERYREDSLRAHSEHIELIAELKEKQTGKEEMDAVVQTLKKTREERDEAVRQFEGAKAQAQQVLEREKAVVRALKKTRDDVMKERDEAVRLCKEAQREKEHLREQFEGARAQAQQVLEREKAKFEDEIQKLKQEQQATVEAEKEAVRHKYRAKYQEKLAHQQQEESSQLKQLYKQAMEEREKEYQQRFLEYANTIKELSQKSTELCNYQQEATRQEFELRAELDQTKEAAARDVEHLQAQYQAELRKRDSQLRSDLQQEGQEEGGEQSLKWENQHLHQVVEQQKGVISRLEARLGETEDEVEEPGAKMVLEDSVKMSEVQRMWSKSSQSSDASEEPRRYSRSRSCDERKIQELQDLMDVKQQEVEILEAKLQEKEERIQTLNGVIKENEKTAKRGLRGHEVDVYMERVTTLTEQLCKHDSADMEQKKELTKLRKMVANAEQMEGQLNGALKEIEALEEQNQSLRGQVRELQLQGLHMAAGKPAISSKETQKLQTLMETNRKMRQELDGMKAHRMQQHTEIQQLQETSQAKDRAIFQLESEKAALVQSSASVSAARKPAISSEETQKLQTLMDANRQVRQERDGARALQIEQRREIQQLRENSQAKDRAISQLESEKAALMHSSASVSAARAEIDRMKRQLQIKEKEIARLKSTISVLSSTPDEPSEEPQHAVEVARLKKQLKEKDDAIRQLQRDMSTVAREGETSQLLSQKDELAVMKQSVEFEITSLQGNLTTKPSSLASAEDTSTETVHSKPETQVPGLATGLASMADENERWRRQLSLEKKQPSSSARERWRQIYGSFESGRQASLERWGSDKSETGKQTGRGGRDIQDGESERWLRQQSLEKKQPRGSAREKWRQREKIGSFESGRRASLERWGSDKSKTGMQTGRGGREGAGLKGDSESPNTSPQHTSHIPQLRHLQVAKIPSPSFQVMLPSRPWKPQSRDYTTSGVASPPSHVHVSTTSVRLQRQGSSDRDHGDTDLSSQLPQRTTESDKGDRSRGSHFFTDKQECVCM